MLTNDLLDEKKLGIKVDCIPPNCSPQVPRTPVSGTNARTILVASFSLEWSVKSKSRKNHRGKHLRMSDSKKDSNGISVAQQMRFKMCHFKVEDHRYAVARAKIQAQNLGMTLVPKSMRAVSVITRPHVGKKEQQKLLRRGHLAGFHSSIPNEHCALCQAQKTSDFV